MFFQPTLQSSFVDVQLSFGPGGSPSMHLRRPETLCILKVHKWKMKVAITASKTNEWLPAWLQMRGMPTSAQRPAPGEKQRRKKQTARTGAK